MSEQPSLPPVGPCPEGWCIQDLEKPIQTVSHSRVVWAELAGEIGCPTAWCSDTTQTLIPRHKPPPRHALRVPALHSPHLPSLENSAGQGQDGESAGVGTLAVRWRWGKTSPLSKATQFSHFLSLHKESPQKKGAPKVTAGCSRGLSSALPRPVL